jgi:hypothetical protein
MAGKPSPRKRPTRSDDTNEEVDVRPKGPAAAGFTRQQGTKKFRRQRANS